MTYYLLVELLDVEYYRDLGMWVRGQSRSSKLLQQLRCGFLFALCGAILYHLQDIATYWSKIAKFIYQPVFSARRGRPRRNFANMLDTVC